jgi:hypothetical protein
MFHGDGGSHGGGALPRVRGAGMFYNCRGVGRVVPRAPELRIQTK